MKNKFIILLAAVALVGCRDENDPETRAINQVNANSPVFVADTPKGKLYRIAINRGNQHPDRVYYFDNSNEVNVNQTKSSGKASQVETSIIVNGKEYVPKN